MNIALSQRAQGQFYTRGNPFQHPAFLKWAQDARLSSRTVLEPFAGQNGLIEHLQDMGLCSRFKSYDLNPASPAVKRRNTLANFPKGYEVCVTNPPWLARNSATARGIAFPHGNYDDLYQVALRHCLAHCEWVAALVPESFIRANRFQERLRVFISLTMGLFDDTGHPVGLALFAPKWQADVAVWSGMQYVDALSAIEAQRLEPEPDGVEIRFNDPDGNVGLIALDNTREASIRFCDVRELKHYNVKHTSRHITKISVSGGKKLSEWNDALTTFRLLTHDVLMTCYKGIRKDGMYRRRCDWRLARGIIHHVG